jgi:hypothetical protein
MDNSALNKYFDRFTAFFHEEEPKKFRKFLVSIFKLNYFDEEKFNETSSEHEI